MTTGKEMVIEIPIEEGDPLGATPNDKLVIVKVQAGTLAEDKLKVGDQILKLNDTAVRDTNHFFQLLRFAAPVARINLIRDEEKAAEIEAKVHIPPERMKFVQRRDGFEYLMSKLEWKAGGPKLGLGIRHYQNRVLVSRCDPNSLAAAQLKVGDHIVDIDGKPVTDKDVAREILLKSLQTQGFATMVIERPESMEAKHWTTTALTANPAQPPSVMMNSDVRDIAARERAKLKERAAQGPKKSILGGAARDRKVVIQDRVGDHIIASDNEGKNLRPVRKKRPRRSPIDRRGDSESNERKCRRNEPELLDEHLIKQIYNKIIVSVQKYGVFIALSGFQCKFGGFCYISNLQLERVTGAIKQGNIVKILSVDKEKINLLMKCVDQHTGEDESVIGQIYNGKIVDIQKFGDLDDFKKRHYERLINAQAKTSLSE